MGKLLRLDKCSGCGLLIPEKATHNCDHCKKPYCFGCLMQHDSKVQAERAAYRQEKNHGSDPARA